MDYKLPSSGMEDRMYLENLPLLEERDTLKFVCSSREDMEKAAQIIEKFRTIRSQIDYGIFLPVQYAV